MALRTLAARTRSAALQLAAPAPRFSPPATISPSPAAPRVWYSKSSVISMGVPATTGSGLLLSRPFSSPAIRGRTLISTAHAQQSCYYSNGALVIDEGILRELVTGVAKCSSVANECLSEIHTVQALQVITLVILLSGITGACYVGGQVMERASEILGQLEKHAPEILGDVCGEVAFQMKIPFFGKRRRLVLKDHWFNNPEKSLSRSERKKKRELAREATRQRQREEFNRAEHERKLVFAPLYEVYMARKEVNDQRTMERLVRERIHAERLQEERLERLTGYKSSSW